MKFLVFTALVATWGSVVVQGYGTRNHHKHYSHHEGRSSHSPHGCHEHESHEFRGHGSHGSHGHGSRRSHGHGSHGHHAYPHHNGVPHGDFRHPPRYDSFESGENSYGSYEGLGDYDSSESSGERNWYGHNHHYHGCRGWRCPPHTTRRSYHHRTTTPKSSRPWPTIPSTVPDVPQRWEITNEASPTVWFIPGDPNNWQTDVPSSIIPIPSRTTSNSNTSIKDPSQLITSTSGPDTDQKETTAPIDDAIFECITTCPATPEYNPVCGTDGETYSNIGRLSCAKSCGIDVELRRTSACPPPSPPPGFDEESPRPVRSDLTISMTTTDTPRIGRATGLTVFQQCMRQCEITSEYKPVCGTDFTTYINIDRLNCARGCGQDVEVLCDRSCGACYVQRPITSSTTAAPEIIPSINTNIGRVPISAAEEQCLSSCSVTTEVNPICGSDGVTYTNPSQLLCAQLCGQDVKVAQFAPCAPTTPAPPTTTTVMEDEPVTLSPEISACLVTCPVTTQYNPVCGTDGRTYDNIGRLECANFCGINVELRASRPCFLVIPELDQITASTNSRTKKNENDVSADPKLPLDPSTTVPTIPTTVPSEAPPTPASSTQATPTTPTTIQPVVNFTISEDLLNNIFNTDTSTPAEEQYDIDPRFGENENQTTTTIPRVRRKHKNTSFIFPE